MGDGVLGNQSIGNLTNVISPKKTVTVTRVFVVPADQRANVGMYFTNADVTTAFTWREIGLYALDPDEGEILYWYGYDVTGTVIPVGGGSEILEQTFDTMVFVGTAQNVSSTVSQSLVFVTITEMNQVLTDSKAYTDSKFASATIPDASLTQKGKVQLSNAIDSTSQSLAATAKAVSDARQAAIIAAEEFGRTTILNLAGENTATYVNERPWQKFKLTQDNGMVKTLSGGYDLNSAKETGHYYVFNPVNGPAGFGPYHVEIMAQSATNLVQKATFQAAIPETYVRSLVGTTWSLWVTQNKRVWGAL
ncbi:pyocin knob domain-containing protein [Paenibacillus sp. UASWS1643]|uniref:pyocin knob domain-containing protein n=1 Tax=Paenibacillus sp. UASWS1643 TaxID=2580422 RepID=UPI0016888962|nr:pyocin knob domain-containing protein [Paenibacillus sp. UASWS1643]